MENLNAEAVYIIFNEINHRLTEQYERTTIAWHRYKECGANKELYQKIYDLLTILKEQGNQIAEDISKEIITIFSFYFAAKGLWKSGLHGQHRVPSGVKRVRLFHPVTFVLSGIIIS